MRNGMEILLQAPPLTTSLPHSLTAHLSPMSPCLLSLSSPQKQQERGGLEVVLRAPFFLAGHFGVRLARLIN